MRELAARVRLLIEIVVRGSPRLALVGLLLFAARYAVVPLTAIGLRAVVDAASSGDALRAALIALVVAALWVVELPIDAVMNREGLNLADMNRIALEGEMIELTQGSARVDHLEAPEFSDRLETVQALSGDIFWAYGGVVGTVVLAVQFVVVCLLLGSVSPILIVLIVLSLAPIVCGQLAERIVGRARDASAQASRQRRHLLDIAANPTAAKEIRVFALADELRRRRNQADQEASDILDRAHVRAGLLRGLGEAVFGLGFAGALYVVVNAGIHHTASIGDAVLTVSLAVSVSAQLVYVVGGLDRLQLALNQAGALLRLHRSVAAADSAAGTLQPPDVLRDGIVLEDVSFQYPAANDAALRGMSVRLPAGTVIALVGENGAGKSTLIKLLAGLHRPDSGRILVEGVALDDIDLRRWRERITGAFQDFARLETLAGETVGLGDHPRKDEEAAVRTALERASADDLHAHLPEGLRTQLGRSYADGTELSGGQWQKLALARGMMADAPLLLFLDEPTAALDPHAEHLLFESYAERAKVAGRELGAITILVSHRFSTVRMADLILVINDGRVAEAGTHAELMAHRGHYATVYELQANAYR